MLCFPFGRPGGRRATVAPLAPLVTLRNILRGASDARAPGAIASTASCSASARTRPYRTFSWRWPHATADRTSLAAAYNPRRPDRPAQVAREGRPCQSSRTWCFTRRRIPNRSSRTANAWPQSCWKRPTLRLSTAIPPRSIGDREASAPASSSRGPGNGILRAETGGRIQARTAGERSEFGSQTPLRLTNPPELRGLL